MKAKQQKPFRVFLRKEGSYELSLAVRFEVAEGYGALVLQRQDANKDPPPTLVYEEREISAKELRGGRFIHVLPASNRRQSYALSRLSEEMLQNVPDDGWTELNALTEYGFRYLVTPDNLAALPPKPAAVQVTPPPAQTVSAGVAPVNVAVGAAPARAAVAARVAAAPARSEPGPQPAPQGPPALTAQAPSGAPSALQRAMAAIRAGRTQVGSITGNTELGPSTPRPAPTAKVSGPGAVGRSTRPTAPPAVSTVTSDLGDIDGLDRAEAIATVKELAGRLSDLEKKYADSLTRERDLLEVLTRWQQREIG